MSYTPSLPSLLLVEDDNNIASALNEALCNSYNMETVNSGRMAIYKTDKENYEVIILDLNLPDMNGLDVCLQLRERGQKTPILILSGEFAVLTKIKLLDAGANDYLTKPCSLGELKARLRALVRINKSTEPKVPESLSVYGLTLNLGGHTVKRDGIEIRLRRKEFALLECLMMHAGIVVSRTTLGNFAWQMGDDTWTNTVDVHIKHLRDKIDRPFDSPLITTVHGIGYKLQSNAVHLAEITS